MDVTSVEYIGKDLEAMELARNYHKWIFDLMKPHLGRRIVEVGAGTADFQNFCWSSSRMN